MNMSDAPERNLVTAFLYPKAKNSLAKSTSFPVSSGDSFDKAFATVQHKPPFFSLGLRWLPMQFIFRCSYFQVPIFVQVIIHYNVTITTHKSQLLTRKKSKGYFVLTLHVILWLAALCSHIPGCKNSSYLNKPGLRQRKRTNRNGRSMHCLLRH